MTRDVVGSDGCGAWPSGSSCSPPSSTSHPRPGRLPRLRQRRGRGVDGGRDRRLVRRDRAVPPPARAADPAHRAGPEAQGRSGPRPRGVLRGELPPGGDHPRAGGRREHRAPDRGVGGGSPTTRDAWSTRSPRSRGSRWARSRTSTSRTWSRRAGAAVPRGADLAAAGHVPRRGRPRRPAPRRGRPGARGAAPLVGGATPRRCRRAERAGAVVGAAAAQRGGHHADPRRDGALDR